MHVCQTPPSLSPRGPTYLAVTLCPARACWPLCRSHCFTQHTQRTSDRAFPGPVPFPSVHTHAMSALLDSHDVTSSQVLMMSNPDPALNPTWPQSCLRTRLLEKPCLAAPSPSATRLLPQSTGPTAHCTPLVPFHPSSARPSCVFSALHVATCS